MKLRGLLFVLGFVALATLMFVTFKSKSSNDSRREVAYSEEVPKSKETESQKIEQEVQQPSSTEASQASAEEPADDKTKPLSLEKEVSLLEKKYPSVLNKKGFTEHEAEVILRFQIEEIRENRRTGPTAIERAVKELQLTAERKELLNQAFDETFVGLVEYTMDDIAVCMNRRLSKSSECTKSILEDFLKDLSLALDTGIFEPTPKVTQITLAAIKKATDVCKETPERANVQFRLVFVECDPM